MKKENCIRTLYSWRNNIKNRISFLSKACILFSFLHYTIKISGLFFTVCLLSLDSALLSKITSDNYELVLGLTITIVILQGLSLINQGIDTLCEFNKKSKQSSISAKQYSELIDEINVLIQDLQSQIEEEMDPERLSYITLLYQSKIQSVLENQPKLYFGSSSNSITHGEIEL